MPLKHYFSGHGDEVASDMKKRYGRDWKRVFYATANKTGQTAEDYQNPHHSHPFSRDPMGKKCMICGMPMEDHKIK